MQIVLALFIGVTIVAGFLSGNPASDDTVVLLTGKNGDISIVRHVYPASESNFKGVIPQKYDYSCSAAAICTMLNHGYGETLTELEVITGLMGFSEKNDVIASRAFSLNAMKSYVAGLGYDADGFRVEGLDDIQSASLPCIVPVSIYGYYHFVVIKGLHDGRVFIADPFQGNISFTKQEFKTLWYNRFLFAVKKNSGDALNRLVVTSKDLRMIDESMAKSYLLRYRDRYNVPDEQGVSNKLYYRH